MSFKKDELRIYDLIGEKNKTSIVFEATQYSFRTKNE